MAPCLEPMIYVKVNNLKIDKTYYSTYSVIKTEDKFFDNTCK